jgi:hypothetical protein
MEAAGGAVAKRAAPVVAALALGAIVFSIVRRRNR